METTQCGLVVKTPKQNLPKLEKYLEFHDEIVHVLQKVKEAGQLLSIRIVQPILKGIIQSFVPQLIRPKHGGFNVTRKWSRQFMK
jgi:hypothetical protein